MEEIFDLTPDCFGESCEKQLMLQIDVESENRFLEKIGYENARERDIVAFVDQYAATGITMLCFPLCNEKYLPVWLARCRKVGLLSSLVLTVEQATQDALFAGYQTQAIIIDGRGRTGFNDLSALKETLPDVQLVLLVDCSAESDLLDFDAVIVCPAQKSCRQTADEAWLAKKNDLQVYACVHNFLCIENDKQWYPTPEILNGVAVSTLSKGFDGLYLFGFCADPFDVDSALYDIYDTCGNLSDAIGARRRHLYGGRLPVAVLPGADLNVSFMLGPVFDGGAVCLLTGADHEDALAVFVNEKEAEKTGTPVIVARNEQGRECEDACIATSVKCSEFFVQHDEMQNTVAVRIHNCSQKTVEISWIEMTVNI